VLGAIFPRPERARTRGCEARARIFPVCPDARPTAFPSSRPPARTPTTVPTPSVVALELNQPRGRGRSALAAPLIPLSRSRAGKIEARVQTCVNTESPAVRRRGTRTGPRIRGRSDRDRSEQPIREAESGAPIPSARGTFIRASARLFAPALPRGRGIRRAPRGGSGSRGKTDAGRISPFATRKSRCLGVDRRRSTWGPRARRMDRSRYSESARATEGETKREEGREPADY